MMQLDLRQWQKWQRAKLLNMCDAKHEALTNLLVCKGFFGGTLLE